jgi:CheY-like chemotaxis protein
VSGQDEIETMTAASSDLQAPSAPRGASETVLVVEDDPRLRQVTCDRIADLGYHVLVASDGATAMGVLEQNPGVQLLFSDIVMPGGMSGLDLARRGRERYPALRIVLTTGYAPELVDETGENIGLLILRKPYRKAELAKVLHEALRPR